MTAIVVRADARDLPLPDESVDLIVTSPPYYSLRSYTDAGEHYAGQIGSEASPAEWLQALLACTREWMRVLKPTGSIFVNLGDTYSGKANAGVSVGRSGRADHATVIPVRHNTASTAPYKSLLCMPERYRIACIDELGLTVRANLIWDKPNSLPESVTDRVRRSHEDWVHLTLGPHYYAAVDAIRETHARSWTPGRNGGRRPAQSATSSMYDGLVHAAKHPLGRLPGSVWKIASERAAGSAGASRGRSLRCVPDRVAASVHPRLVAERYLWHVRSSPPAGGYIRRGVRLYSLRRPARGRRARSLKRSPRLRQDRLAQRQRSADAEGPRPPRISPRRLAGARRATGGRP